MRQLIWITLPDYSPSKQKIKQELHEGMMLAGSFSALLRPMLS